MSQVYFHKNGRLAISYRDGTKVPFEPLGDARNVIVLDGEKDAGKVAELREYVSRRIGGVSEIKAEDYESVKKNHPYRPEETYNRRTTAKLFQNVVVPKAPQASAPAVEGAASARRAAAGVPVQDAMEQEGHKPLPISRGRKIKVGRVTSEGEVKEASSTSNPAAGSGASATPETTEG